MSAAAIRIMRDRSALQYHNAVGQPQNLLRVLLDDDGADAARTCNRAQRFQQFLDNDGRQPLGRLVQQQHFRVRGQRPADRQHLLLAAGELVAEIAPPLLQARKHLVDPLHRPRPRLRHRGHVLFHGERAEDVALLRHPADPGPRALVGAQRGDVGAAERQRPAEAAGDADDGVDQRGLAGAVAPEQRQHLPLRQGQRHLGQHHRLAVAGAQALDAKQVSHGRPRRDRRLSPAGRARPPRAGPRPAARR